MDLPDEIHQEVSAVAGFAYGAVGADIHVFGDGTPVYLLYARDTHGAADALRRDSAWLRAQPSRMLDARSEIVEFTGREAELARLRQWRDQPARSAVRWLHGPGGAGKSRLAARFAAECADAGWLVVDAVHGTDTYPPAEGSQDLRTAHRAGVLLLVDYADRWPDAHLSWLFQNGLLLGELPARVILIARSVRPWPALRAQLSRQRRATDLSDQPLEPLSGQRGERGEMFETAHRSFAAHYPDPAALSLARPPYEVLDRPDFGLPLALHMAALVAVDARAGGWEPPADLVGMTAYLLDREHENWRRPGALGTGIAPDARHAIGLARTVFTAVLTGPMRREAAAPLLDRLLSRTPVDNMLSAHAAHYPPTDPAAAHVLEPLLPDRLGEDYLALTLPGSPVTGYPTDLWSVTAIARILQRDAGSAPAWTPRALNFLLAAAERWPHIGPAVLFPLLRRDPALAVRGGSAVLASLAALRSVDLDVLEAIEPLLLRNDVRVATGAGELRVRLVTHRLQDAVDPAERARLCQKLASAHLKSGHRSEALPHMEESVRLAREAAEQDPAHRSAYADALLNLGGLFLDEISPERRTTLLQEAIELLREDGESPPHVLGVLAEAYTRLAMAHMGTGAWGKAHAAVAEAERLFEEVLERDVALWVDMHRAVNDLLMVRGLLQIRSDRPQEAAEGAGVAVANTRSLAALNPAGYGDDLAGNLHLQSRYLWEAGRHAESVDALLKAVHLYRQLAEVHASYRHKLADRLDDAAAKLIALDRHTEAVAIVEEVLALHRRHLAAAPDTPEAAEAARAAIGRALLYLRERRGADRLPWGTAAEIDEAAEALVRAADPAGLWALMCGIPVADTIRIAHRHPPRHWAPPPADTPSAPAPGPGPEPASGPGPGLASRLASRRHRPAAADRTARDAAELSVWRPSHAGNLAAPDRVSFAPAQPVMAWETYAPHHEHPLGDYATRVDVYDLSSRSLLWSADHFRVGTGPVACLGPDAFLALRTETYQAVPQLVLYRPDRAEVLAHGRGLAGARIFATAHGFVVLLQGVSIALVGEVGRPMIQVDLESLGLNSGCTAYAVDPSGQRLLLAGYDDFVLTDAALEPVSSHGALRLPRQHGAVEAAVFLSPDEFVTAASTGGVYLFQQESDDTLVTAWTSPGPRMEHLFAVPAWRVVGGRARGEGSTRFFDSAGLVPVAAPRLPAGRSDAAPRAMTASPGGRYVVHGAAVHDLGLPLSFAERPIASLTPADLAALRAYLDDGRAPSAALRELLELVRDLGSALSPPSPERESDRVDPREALQGHPGHGAPPEPAAFGDPLDLHLDEPDDLPTQLRPDDTMALRERLEEAERRLGPGHEEVLRLRHTFVAILGAWSAAAPPGDTRAHDRSIALLLENLAHQTEQLGPYARDTLTTCRLIGTAHLWAGRPAQAIPYFEQALDGSERSTEGDNEQILSTRENLSDAYAATGLADQAIALLEETVALSKRLLPPAADVLTARKDKLFQAYHRADRRPEAIALAQEIIGDRERFYGPDHLATYIWVDNLAHLHHDARDLDAAISCYERAVHGFEQIHGTDSPEVAYRYHNLAIAHLEDAHPDRAVPYLEAALAAREASLGPDHGDTLDSLNTLASGYAQANRLTDAATTTERLIAAMERTVGRAHPGVTEARAYLDGLRQDLT